jgi:hypothetical protein
MTRTRRARRTLDLPRREGLEGTNEAAAKRGGHARIPIYEAFGRLCNLEGRYKVPEAKKHILMILVSRELYVLNSPYSTIPLYA